MSPEATAGASIYSIRLEHIPLEPLVAKLENAGYRVIQALE
jgi:hypothetical protein